MDVEPSSFLLATPVTGRISRTGETLHRIRRDGPATVSELADAMGVARSTVVERLDRLQEHDLIRALPSRPAGPGRPATSFRFEPDAGRILTCHLGMTGMQLGLTDLSAALVAHRSLDLDIERGPEVVVVAIEEGFDALLAEVDESPARVQGIGVGLPSSVEMASNAVTAGHPWTGYPIADRLQSRFDAPTFVDQDVNLLALGEQEAWPDTQVLLCVKVGSVIGCGIVVDGRIVEGTSGLAGEIGHTRIPGHDAPCGCGNRGCLNTVAGGTALVASLAGHDLPITHVRDIVRLAGEGVDEAGLAVHEAGRQIGTVLAGAVNLLNPGVISLWGYLVGAEEQLLAGVRETLYQGATPSATHQLQLVSSELGKTTGLTGAALMVVEKVLAPHAVDLRLDAAEREAEPAHSS